MERGAVSDRDMYGKTPLVGGEYLTDRWTDGKGVNTRKEGL